jgi:hypothetical protein
MPADQAVGETAGWATCATTGGVPYRQSSEHGTAGFGDGAMVGTDETPEIAECAWRFNL